MIPVAILTWFRTNPRNVWLIGLLVAALIAVLVIYNKGRHDAHAKDKAARAVAVAEALKDDNLAKERALVEREHDAAVQAELREELTNAVADVPDTVPDPAAVQLGCQRLRNANRDVSNLPACR